MPYLSPGGGVPTLVGATGVPIDTSVGAAAWVDIDLAAQIPVGTSRVQVMVQNMSAISYVVTGVREPGSPSLPLITLRPSTTDLADSTQIVQVTVGATRRFDALRNAVAAVRVTLLGYYR